tara:strand:- start:346 stop:951 length:606 start_codon:yes stop_codon:yes gene_type:complete
MNFSEIKNLVVSITSRPDLEIQINSRIKWAVKHAHTLVDQDSDLVDVLMVNVTNSASKVGTFPLPARMRKPVAVLPHDEATNLPYVGKFLDLLKATSLVEAQRRGEDVDTYYINSLGMSYKTDQAIRVARMYYYAFPDITSAVDETEVGLMVEYGEAIADLVASKVLQSVGENEQSGVLFASWQTVATDIINTEGRQPYAN